MTNLPIDPSGSAAAESRSSFSIAPLLHTLHRYRPVIALAMAAVAVGAAILLIAAYLMAPFQRVTSQPFRLEFKGATVGEYPNGVKFSAAEIAGTPILLQVYRGNELAKFVPFEEFGHAILIVQSNAQLENLAADYQAQLSDPRLTAVDRDRIRREWQARSDALDKNSFSINYVLTQKSRLVPATLVQKALLDILSGWAADVINEQHVVQYQLAVLTPELMDERPAERTDHIMGLQVLRSKIHRVLDNIRDLQEVPGAEVVHTKSNLTLAEIQARLEDIDRFRLEPLASTIRGSGLMTSAAAATRFIEAQLAYDQRELRARQQAAEQVRQALAVYTVDQRVLRTDSRSATGPAAQAPSEPPAAGGLPRNGETVMPQLSDSFLDRLVALSAQSNDVKYRQKMIEDYRRLAARTIPADEAVAYDQQLLRDLKGDGAPAGQATAATVTAELDGARAEAKRLTGEVNEVYTTVSHNLNPSTELYTLTAPPVTRTERAVSLSRLGLYGLLLLLLALPIVVLLCLVHHHMREEA
jgi:hypothetical protein